MTRGGGAGVRATKEIASRRWRPRGLAIGAAVVGAVLVLFLVLRYRSRAPSEEALFQGKPAHEARQSPTRAGAVNAARPRSRAVSAEAPRGADDDSDPADDSAEGPRGDAERRLDRARRTLDTYLRATRYPPGSRPLSEHPDLVRPHSVAPSTQPLARKDGKRTSARVTLEQDRYFLVGDEAARLVLSCATGEGPAPCEIVSAEARVGSAMPQAGAIPAAPVLFQGDGSGARAALFAPAREGFAGYHGPIDVALSLRVGGEEGGAAFELQYTPSAPARFTGRVREALEDGSLCLHVEMTVERAGRYVLHARADGADGEGFAYLEFNEPLAAGRQEATMCLFGKLVLDQHARSSFVLRDLEGFLLLENAYPDRELIPSLEGPVYTTKAYEDSAFSDAEWQSEEKKRHVDEFTKDVAAATNDLAGVDKGAGEGR